MKPIPLVYFIATKDKPRSPVKIGRSNSEAIYGRIDSLQTSHPHKLEFLFVMEGGPAEERSAHKAFADIRLQGEWFKRTKAMNDVIAELQRLHPDWRSLLSFPHLEYDEDGKRIFD